MTQEQIHANLDAMLANPKSKPFLNHLVKAYLPVENITNVLDKPEGKFTCVLTNTPLISVGEILNGMETEAYKKDFNKSLKSMFDESAEKINPIVNLLGDKKLGITGKDTTTFMDYQTYQVFLNWVVEKSFSGDKHINWLLGDIRRKTFVERAKNSDKPEVQKRARNLEKKPNVTTYSLGESSDVLAKLKAKMDGE